MDLGRGMRINGTASTSGASPKLASAPTSSLTCKSMSTDSLRITAPWLRSGTGQSPTPPSADGHVTIALRHMSSPAGAPVLMDTPVFAAPWRITMPPLIRGVMHGSTRPVRLTEPPTGPRVGLLWLAIGRALALALRNSNPTCGRTMPTATVIPAMTSRGICLRAFKYSEEPTGR